MKIENGDVIFDTGKVLYAHGGAISMDGDGNLAQGYDGGFDSGRVGLSLWERWQKDPLLCPHCDGVRPAAYAEHGKIEECYSCGKSFRVLFEESGVVRLAKYDTDEV